MSALKVTAILALLVASSAQAHLFAVHENIDTEGTVTTTTLFEETAICAKREGGWKDAMFRVEFRTGYVKMLPACWHSMTAADAVKMRFKPNVIMVCPLPNNFVGTACSFILKDEFINPASLPKPAFPDN